MTWRVVFGRAVKTTDRLILRIQSQRTSYSQETTFVIPIFFCLAIWFSFLDALSGNRVSSDVSAIALTMIIVLISFCIVRYMKVTGDLWSSQTETNILQIKDNATRIKNEAEDAIRIQNKNSKSLSDSAQSNYAKEIRSEVIADLEQERTFQESELMALSLAVTEAKRSANLLQEQAKGAHAEADRIQHPLALAQEKAKSLAAQRGALNQDFRNMQNEYDSKAARVAELSRELSHLEGETAQLQRRLNNLQNEIGNGRSSRTER